MVYFLSLSFISMKNFFKYYESIISIVIWKIRYNVLNLILFFINELKYYFLYESLWFKLY